MSEFRYCEMDIYFQRKILDYVVNASMELTAKARKAQKHEKGGMVGI